MKSLLSIIDSISEWSGKAFAFVILVATLTVVFSVMMRYVFNSPLTWGLELSIYLAASSYLMGGAYALLYDAHVKVDVLYMQWSPKMRAIVDLITAPLFFISIGTLAWLGAQWTLKAISGGITSGSSWGPVVWPMRSLISLGSFLLLLQGMAKFVRDLKVAKGEEPYER
ncbi:TRAP transporter small permease subunit [Chloroflexota bacterium]